MPRHSRSCETARMPICVIAPIHPAAGHVSGAGPSGRGLQSRHSGSRPTGTEAAEGIPPAKVVQQGLFSGVLVVVRTDGRARRRARRGDAGRHLATPILPAPRARGVNVNARPGPTSPASADRGEAVSEGACAPRGPPQEEGPVRGAWRLKLHVEGRPLGALLRSSTWRARAEEGVGRARRKHAVPRTRTSRAGSRADGLGSGGARGPRKFELGAKARAVIQGAICLQARWGNASNWRKMHQMGDRHDRGRAEGDLVRRETAASGARGRGRGRDRAA